jgi:hypothetical protein
MPSSSIPQQDSSTTPIYSSLSSSPSTTTTTNANPLLSSSTTTVIPNDNLNDQTDEISSRDIDTNIDQSQSSITTNDEPVDDRTKYGEKRK